MSGIVSYIRRARSSCIRNSLTSTTPRKRLCLVTLVALFLLQTNGLHQPNVAGAVSVHRSAAQKEAAETVRLTGLPRALLSRSLARDQIPRAAILEIQTACDCWSRPDGIARQGMMPFFPGLRATRSLGQEQILDRRAGHFR